MKNMLFDAALLNTMLPLSYLATSPYPRLLSLEETIKSKARLSRTLSILYSRSRYANSAENLLWIPLNVKKRLGIPK